MLKALLILIPYFSMIARETILGILEDKEVKLSGMEEPERYSHNEDLDEISTAALYDFTFPYIKGAIADRQSNMAEALRCFREYCDECGYLKLVSTGTIELCRRFSRTRDRSDKIALLNVLGRFKYSYIDWEDREWAIALLEHLYIRATQSIIHLEAEMRLSEHKVCVAEEREMECIRIDTRGNRENVLVRRNNPEVTLDEFADRIMANIAKAEAGREAPSNEEGSTEEESREEGIRKSEFNDEKHIRRGNTRGMG
jgi:hypothetical protein